MLTRRQVLCTATWLAGAVATGSHAFAQSATFPETFPNRPIKIIVPFAAGGGVDSYARLLADAVTRQTGAKFVIDNRGGGNGTVGGNAVKGAAADGYTLLFSAGTHVMARQVMKNAPYDPLTDFTPIARVGEAPMLLVIAPDSKPRTVSELIAALKQEPAKWTFGTSALGAPGHLATLAFIQAAGAPATVLPYRGTAPALNDVAGAHIQAMIDPVLALLPMATEKKVIGLAITSAKRTKLAPEIPTLAEGGLDGFDHSSWYGLWGPKALAPEMIVKLNQMFASAVRLLDSEGRLAQLGIEPVTESPQAFADYAAQYVARNVEVLKAASFDPV